jgi:hypothetical protein
MDEEKKCVIDANKDNLSRVIGFANVMDGKATFILTLALALTGYLVAQLGGYADAYAKWSTAPNWGPTFYVILDAAAVGCLTCFTFTAMFVIRCIKPRVTRHTGKTSPFFFMTIAEGAHDDFRTTMRALTPDAIIDHVIDQTYDNAKIVQAKTLKVQRSFTLFLCGLSCFLVFTVGRPILLSLSPPPLEKPAKTATRTVGGPSAHAHPVDESSKP